MKKVEDSPPFTRSRYSRGALYERNQPDLGHSYILPHRTVLGRVILPLASPSGHARQEVFRDWDGNSRMPELATSNARKMVATDRINVRKRRTVENVANDDFADASRR